MEIQTDPSIVNGFICNLGLNLSFQTDLLKGKAATYLELVEMSSLVLMRALRLEGTG